MQFCPDREDWNDYRRVDPAPTPTPTNLRHLAEKTADRIVTSFVTDPGRTDEELGAEAAALILRALESVASAQPAAPEVDGEPDYKALYFDLIYQVGSVWPDESRHETAKRYIREREELKGGPDQCGTARQQHGEEGKLDARS